MTGLVERDSQLEALRELMASAAAGEGRVALVCGEAGIGKTSLLRALASERRAELWWGSCDALHTPHPLAPLHDIARETPVGFAELIARQAPRPALFEAVLAALRRSAAILFVIEDTHWADEATLDLVKFIGRRIDRLPVLLAVSFRDDEVGAAHPLRAVIGELSPRSVSRIELPRLSPGGVDILARQALRASTGLHAITGGNPFFVTELLRRAEEGLPQSVQDLVLARLARLAPGARSIVQLASIFPARVERALVRELLATTVSDLEACLNSGLLLAEGDFLRFRHELARVAVENALEVPVAQELHARALHALRTWPGASVARLVHHAVHGRDREALRELAPRAAEEALARGSHREAAAHFEAALAAGASSDEERARWLEAYAVECQAIDQLDKAIAARDELAALFRRRGDVIAEARNLSQSALVYVLALRNPEADRASRRAIELLESQPPGPELACAYRIEGQLRMLNRDCRESVAWGRKALALAERFNDAAIVAAAHNTLGTATMFLDYEAGCEELRRALALAQAGGMHYVAANVYSNLGSGSGELMRIREAERYLLQAIEYSTRHEIDFYRHYALSWLALCEVYLGRWEDAAIHAHEVIAPTRHGTTSRIMALVALGRIHARRGEPAAGARLDEALELATATGTLQRLAPVKAARAEHALLRGDAHAAACETREALELALRHEHPWFTGELACWLREAGALAAVPACCAEPYALQLSGRWVEAAAYWEALGCPFERAQALAMGDAAAKSEALAILEALGAVASAQALRRRMRAEGVRVVLRGARAATRGNPHGLTARELEILGLLCEGLRNSEIAERLFRSVRTVDHHVEAIFAKLGVDSRAEAVAAAHRSGIAPKNRQAQAQK